MPNRLADIVQSNWRNVSPTMERPDGRWKGERRNAGRLLAGARRDGDGSSAGAARRVACGRAVASAGLTGGAGWERLSGRAGRGGGASQHPSIKHCRPGTWQTVTMSPGSVSRPDGADCGLQPRKQAQTAHSRGVLICDPARGPATGGSHLLRQIRPRRGAISTTRPHGHGT